MSFGGPNRLGGFAGPGGHDLWNPAPPDRQPSTATFAPQTSVPKAPDTPRTAAIKADISNIPSISLGQGKQADYRTILARNNQRIQTGEEPWNNRSMEKAAGIDDRNSAAIRASLRPDTPRTVAIKADISNIPSISLEQGKQADYRTILARNNQRIQTGEEPWNNRSMEKAAGIDPGAASKIRTGKK